MHSIPAQVMYIGEDHLQGELMYLANSEFTSMEAQCADIQFDTT